MWWHTASIIANVLNCHIDPKKRPRGISPVECHPYERKSVVQGMVVNKDTMGTFAAMCGVSPERALRDEAQALARKQAADQIALRMRQRMVMSCN